MKTRQLFFTILTLPFALLPVHDVQAANNAPIISFISGMGPYPIGTSSVELVIGTDVASNCRLATQSGHPYGALYWNFTTQDQRTHRVTVDTYGASSTQTYYARCLNLANNVADSTDFPLAIQFGTSTTTSYPLSVAVTGAGTVTSSPAGIECGTTCSASFGSGKTVKLTAAPASGYRFSGWSGACAGTRLTCSVSMTAAKTVGATFVSQQDTAPPGRSGGSPSGALPAGTTSVNLGLTTNENATCRYATGAGVGYEAMNGSFTQTGATSHSAPIGNLTGGQSYAYYVRCRDTAGNANQDDYPIAFSVSATATYALSVAVTGSGTVTSSPAGIQCGTACSASYAGNASVTLTAAPASGYSFSGWSGACSGTSPTCTVPMTQARSVAASFTMISGGQYPWPVWTSDPVAVPPSSTGNTYYVDGTLGKDTNDGRSPASAFATIKQAVSKIAAGDTVLIRAGLYREGISLINRPSGTATQPITFGSFGDGEVILDGSAKVSGWTQISGSVWTAPVTFTPIAVVVNDAPLKQTYGGVSAVTTGSGKWFYDSAAKTITADVGSGVNPNIADIVVPNNNGEQTHVFFYDGNYYTFKGLTIRGSGAAGIWGYGSHITVERCNIKFNGKAAVSFMGAGNSDNAVLYSHIYHNVLVNWPRGNNNFAESGGGWPGALSWALNYRPLARGNIVYMNGGEGIASYGTQAGAISGSALFEQNVAYDNWSVNMYFDNQPNNIARNNIIFNHPVDTSTWLKTDNVWPWNELYKYTTCMMLGDEQNSSDATDNYANLANTQVYNNLFAGCRIAIRDYAEGASAIQYHGLKNTLIANNTIILPSTPLPNTSTMGIFLQDNATSSGINRNTNSFIQNNIIYGFSNEPLIWAENQNALAGITVSNNVYYSTYATPFRLGFDVIQDMSLADWRSLTKVDASSLFADPLLVNVSGFQASGATPYNYRNADLGASSPARGMGMPQPVFSNNLTGAVRSVWNAGAF